MKRDWSLYEMIPIWLVVSPEILVVSPRVYPIMVGGITKGYLSVICRLLDGLGRSNACVTYRFVDGVRLNDA